MSFFKHVKLRTPESVELEFNLAGIGSRAWALLIDYHVLALGLIVFLIIWSFLAGQVIDLVTEWRGTTEGLELWAAAFTLLVSFVIYVGYFVIFETLWRGQTPGKRLAKIRVICDDGRPARLSQASLRALLRPIDDTFFIGFFMIALGKREKRLGDWVAGTLVVQEARPATQGQLALSDEAQELATNLLQSAAVHRLLPDDFAVVREYLQRRSLMAPAARSQVSLHLARQAKDIIALDRLPRDMTPDVFLEGVYLAYQQQSDQL
jgi:uncharacterized RDD family membrane protein YckC